MSVDRLAIAIASAAYVGFAPAVPGTFGSLAGALIFWVLRSTGVLWIDAVAALLALAIGTWAAHVTERALGRTDPGIVVIDEVLGMLATLAFLPASLPTTLAGFLLFRVFDIAKPFPAATLERVPGGYGIMLDDLMAGIYANLALRLLISVQPGWFL